MGRRAGDVLTSWRHVNRGQVPCVARRGRGNASLRSRIWVTTKEGQAFGPHRLRVTKLRRNTYCMGYRLRATSIRVNELRARTYEEMSVRATSNENQDGVTMSRFRLAGWLLHADWSTFRRALCFVNPYAEVPPNFQAKPPAARSKRSTPICAKACLWSAVCSYVRCHERTTEMAFAGDVIRRSHLTEAARAGSEPVPQHRLRGELRPWIFDCYDTSWYSSSGGTYY